MKWISEAVDALDSEWQAQAQAHQNQLTKPAGSLGELENIAINFCAWQQTLSPKINSAAVRIYAGDHGVAAQGVSAFPQAVTAQMIMNFVHGGAAISVLSKAHGADFKVVNLGTVGKLDEPTLQSPRLIHAVIAEQTADFSETEAMTPIELEQAFTAAKNTVDSLSDTQQCSLFIGGEMGIGNTSSASAIYAALFNLSAKQVCGPGTGVEQAGLIRKTDIVEKALALHRPALLDPVSILRCFGGFEIAALTASYLRCAQKRIPILVDGFICTAAALIAIRIQPNVRDWMLFSHQSAEPAHILALESLQAKPLLNLGMRLGEGSGAAAALPIIYSALTLHNEMASFASANVSTKTQVSE